MIPSSPLTAFSPYLAGRHAVLLSVAAEILERLDACADPQLRAQARGRASDLMWLWTLGAYEVVRTMAQAHRCFSARFQKEIGALKVDLERVRVPNTKMERIKVDRRARSVPVPSNREADLWDEAHLDLCVGDPAEPVSARGLIRRFEVVLASLEAQDVLMGHEASFDP